MKPQKLGVILVLLLASAAGCSASTSADKGPPENGGSYETPEDIAQALDKAGLDCTGLEETPKVNDAVSTANCSSGNDMLTLRVFADREDIEAELDAFDGEETLAGESILAGENWTIVGPNAYVEDAHAKLGGELVDGG